MKRDVYYRGKPGKKYGIWNDVKKEFQFGICEDTPMLAEARLYQKLGDDARKWRFQPRVLPDRRNKGCKYCEGGKTFPTDIDGKASIVKLIPLPAIDLTTGKTEETTDPPFFAIRIKSDAMTEDFVQICYCPKCGKELKEI